MNILADNIHEHAFVGQNCLVIGDLTDQLGIFFCELFDFKAGEPLELHRQNRVGLRAGEELVGFAFCLMNASGRIFLSVAASTRRSGFSIRFFLAVGASGDFLIRFDNVVDIADRKNQTFEDMCAGCGIFSSRNLLRRRITTLRWSMKCLKHLLDIERFRPVIHKGDIDNAERRLKRRKLKSLFKTIWRIGVFFKLDDDPQPLAVGFIAHIGHFRQGIVRARIRRSWRRSWS